MRKIYMIITAGIMLFLFSCSNNTSQSGDNNLTDTSATAAVAEPAVTPFKVILIKHPVKDFEIWKEAYLSHDSIRRAYGISQFILGRGLVDTNTVLVFDKFNDVQKAKQFSALPALKDAMLKAGVTGPPTFNYLQVVRSESKPIEQKERLMVMHHVKDFDAWFKIYDKEGKESRAANGLVERGLCRSVDDSNTVFVFFAITDMAKVKARVASEDLKKIMTEAGVDGPPTIYYYKLNNQ